MILSAADPRLHTACVEVEKFDDRLLDQVEDMYAAMDWSACKGRPAAGLAANQLGLMIRVFLIRGWPHPFINPVVVRVGEETTVEAEGCLSLPEHVLVEIRRPKTVKLTACDLQGTRRTFKLRGRDARCALHELDHLDGVMITDHLPAPAFADRGPIKLEGTAADHAMEILERRGKLVRP